MTAYVQERYKSVICPVTASQPFTGNSTGGFICITSGAIQINSYNGTVRLPAVPVTAGVYLPIPMYVGLDGGTIITSGGASGVLLVG